MVTKILVADDHVLFQAGLCAILAEHSDLKVVASADNGLDAVRRAGESMPDLILSDISMPQCNGTEAIHKIKSRYPAIKILAITFHKEEEYVHAALDAGADGYLLKNDSREALMDAIRSILSGKIYLSPSICSSVVRGYLGKNQKNPDLTPWGGLTHRERQVLKLVAEGYRNREVADQLSISIKTVEKHRSNIMKKLDLNSPSGLTAYAIEHGLISNQQ